MGNYKVIRLFLACLLLFALICSGCSSLGGKSATSQIIEQTNDPTIIAKAGYLDALRAYRSAQDSYILVMDTMEATRPEVAAEIQEGFQAAWNYLKAWKASGLISATDKTNFFDILSQLSLQIAMRLED